MRISILVLTTAFLAGCTAPAPDPTATASPDRGTPAAAAAPAPDAVAGEQVAYLAGGCFWGVEHYLEQLDGVIDVESGYMGGHVDSPSYAQVSSKTSGHLEAVKVRFDPTKVTFEAVAKLFFEIHDPTQADGQGPDLGPQYLSAVFYADDAQKQTTENLIKRLEGRGYDVATEVRPAGQFWAAEEYHQDYYVRTRKQPYCHTRVPRFGD